MAEVTMAIADYALKEHYDKDVQVAIRTSHPLCERLDQELATVSPLGGKAFRMTTPLEITQNWAVEMSSETAALPTPQAGSGDTTTPTLAKIVGSVRLTGDTIDASASNPHAFTNQLDNEVKRMIGAFKLRRNIAYNGDGSGVLARTNGSGSSATTLVVDGPSSIWLAPGMTIDSFTATSGGSTGIVATKISDVSSDGVTATLAAAATWADNEYVYLKNERGRSQIMGLLGIVDDGNGTATLQGIGARTGKSYWQGNLVNGAGAAFSENLVQTAIDTAEINGFSDNVMVDMLLCDYLTRRYAFKVLLTNKQRVVDKQEGKGGFTGLFFQTGSRAVPFFVDRMAYPGYLHGIDSSKLVGGWAPRVGGKWMDRGGSMWRQSADSNGVYDSWEAYYYARHQLVARNTRNHFRLYNYAAP